MAFRLGWRAGRLLCDRLLERQRRRRRRRMKKAHPNGHIQSPNLDGMHPSTVFSIKIDGEDVYVSIAAYIWPKVAHLQLLAGTLSPSTPIPSLSSMLLLPVLLLLGQAALRTLKMANVSFSFVFTN